MSVFTNLSANSEKVLDLLHGALVVQLLFPGGHHLLREHLLLKSDQLALEVLLRKVLVAQTLALSQVTAAFTGLVVLVKFGLSFQSRLHFGDHLLPADRILGAAGRAFNSPDVLGVVGRILDLSLRLVAPVHLHTPVPAEILLSGTLLDFFVNQALLVSRNVLLKTGTTTLLNLQKAFKLFVSKLFALFNLQAHQVTGLHHLESFLAERRGTCLEAGLLRRSVQKHLDFGVHLGCVGGGLEFEGLADRCAEAVVLQRVSECGLTS